MNTALQIGIAMALTGFRRRLIILGIRHLTLQAPHKGYEIICLRFSKARVWTVWKCFAQPGVFIVLYTQCFLSAVKRKKTQATGRKSNPRP